MFGVEVLEKQGSQDVMDWYQALLLAHIPHEKDLRMAQIVKAG